MASSNRHWPSMFKSKPCNSTHHHQWQHDINSSLMSTTGCHRPSYSTGLASEERTPEPKPRWNPRPEQIRILEAIFNSGMVNPPRDEIRKIRAQLQEYGEVGDANVFYWFQNRKSRSKHKQRQLQNNKKSQPSQQTNTPAPPLPIATFVTSPSSSSSSSDKSSPNNSSNEKILSTAASTTVIELLNSPSASVNQPFLQAAAAAAAASNEFLNDPFYFPVQQNTGGSTGAANLTQGFCFPDVAGAVADQGVGNCSGFLLSELMLMNNCPVRKDDDEDDHEKMKLQQHLSYAVTSTAPIAAQPVVPPPLCVSSPTNYIPQGLGEQQPQGQGPAKLTVFINDVCFEVGVGPFNVREAFGDDAVLIQSTGQPVLTNEWGVTLQPLHHGAFYYLVRSFAPSPDDRSTIDLM